jgi:MFS transporter, SP family, general alpha glucoside:H+ symporter
MGEDNQELETAKVPVITGSNSGEEAREAADIEHKMSLWDSLKMYPTAVGWSMFFSLGTIMTAFDPQLLGNLYATPAFQRDFGYLYNGNYIISAPWQTALGMGNPMGQGILLFLLRYSWLG